MRVVNFDRKPGLAQIKYLSTDRDVILIGINDHIAIWVVLRTIQEGLAEFLMKFWPFHFETIFRMRLFYRS